MASARRSCRNNPDVFCYICGEYTLSGDRKNITGFVKRAYMAYFKVKLGDQDKSWAPHTVCKTCGAKTSLKFGIPMVWRKPFYHATDCYFCAINTTGINRKNRQSLQYPDLPSARRPVAHCEDIPRDQLVPGARNIIHEPFVDREKILIPPLHLKLGLMKQFTRALDKDGRCFNYLCRAFPRLTSEKVKAGIFDGPQIRKLIKDTEFQNSMNTLECAAWKSFVQAANHARLISTMIEAFQKTRVFDEYKDALPVLTHGEGERFHQDMRQMEESHDGGLLLVAEVRQHSSCSHTESKKRRFMP
ncbi:Uncharacterized protein FKW44_009061 [Caligus rogercresseyi]|uniref:Uncharacterized protein n=1 Tax=Caligus rogercresseyi TaxID=217165 RepID=A0A7T8HES6_CALRO|nr:Uncharacterized protein FKW44_009061 [Caligus rogercresseyi]